MGALRKQSIQESRDIAQGCAWVAGKGRGEEAVHTKRGHRNWRETAPLQLALGLISTVTLIARPFEACFGGQSECEANVRGATVLGEVAHVFEPVTAETDSGTLLLLHTILLRTLRSLHWLTRLPRSLAVDEVLLGEQLVPLGSRRTLTARRGTRHHVNTVRQYNKEWGRHAA